MRAIGIDQGTSSTRALVLEDGRPPKIVHALRHAQHYPRPGWVEHDPLELLANLRACLAAAGPADSIGLANQGESCLAWDAKTKQPLSPVIVWQDSRSVEAVARLRAGGAEAETLARAGLPLDAYFSAGKFAWMLQHLPEVAAARRANRLRLGTTDAFFLDHLTGVYATDVTTASRTCLMNLQDNAWDPVLCALFGVPAALLPPIRDTVGNFGRAGGTPVTASIVDQQAALFGHGCTAPGHAKITFGTGAFALALTGGGIIRAPARGLLPTAAWRRGGRTTYAVEGGVYDAGAAVDWARRLGLFASFDELSGFAAPPAIGRGLAFVPALSGLACPHWDRAAAALWVGMSAATTKQDMMQAVLEGVALRAAEVIDAIDGQVLISGPIRIDGGLARNDYFAQFLAEVLRREVHRPGFDELTAYGCAVLSRQGAAPDARAGGTSFSPRTAEGPGWQGRFAGAVNRSRAWR